MKPHLIKETEIRDIPAIYAEEIEPLNRDMYSTP